METFELSPGFTTSAADETISDFPSCLLASSNKNAATDSRASLAASSLSISLIVSLLNLEIVMVLNIL